MSTLELASTATLTDHVARLGINDYDEKQDLHPTHAQVNNGVSPSPQASIVHQSEHSRVPSSSSTSSALYSDSSSVPGRPQRSSLRSSRRGGDMTALLGDVNNLHMQVSALLDKIYQIEELRHSPSTGATHASRLDELLSDLNDAVEALAPQMQEYGSSAPSYPNDILTSLRADWGKVVSQHAVLKQELLEDPWLIRFRVTADQAEGMMDPLQTSLQDVTTYVGRIFSSYAPVPMNAPEGRLSIARLHDVVDAHMRLRATYVSSVNKILKIMDKSVNDRAVKNGEALRRVNDLASRWQALQKQLRQLDDKVSLVLAQNDQDHGHSQAHESMEMLDDAGEEYPAAPSYAPYTPPQQHQSDVPNALALHRVFSAGSSHSSSLHAPRTPRTNTTSNGARGHGSSPGMNLAPPPPMPRMGSTTPNAGRTIRKSPSRPSLASSVDRPRWNVSTKPDNVPPVPRIPSGSGSMSGYSTPHKARAQSPVFSSPPGGSSVSRIPRGTPRKSTASTPGRPFTPSGSRAWPAIPSQGRPSFGASLGRGGPPSAYRAISPGNTPIRRPGSSMSVGSIGSTQIAALGLRMFKPSKYDQLDLEVQKVIDAVQPNVFIARLDQAIQRGQRRAEGEAWTGEYVFGVGERSTSVKLLELAGRGGSAEKRRKVMVKVGGAWMDLRVHLERKREEAASMDADDF